VTYRLAAAAAITAGAVVAGACGGSSGGAGAGAAAGGPPPTAVEAVTLATKPVERTGNFVGVVRSRRTTTLQPQVEGFVTAIHVKSGERVRPGAVLMQIDAEPQQALVAGLESQRAAREADLAFVRQQAERIKTLLAAGAASQQEHDQSISALRAGEAHLRTLDEQIRQAKVELAYYRVTAPTAGVIGDIPVRVGDRVTRSTVLSTVNDDAGYEVYVNVPVQHGPDLRLGLPVRLLDEGGRIISTNPIAFVAPSVDDATQTVLVKTAIGENMARFRPEQFVRAQIVWKAEPGLTVPIVALTRINGQFFAFLVESDAKGATLARQRAVQIGPVVGNDYVVASGLAAGDRLIVSGIQKIGDGMPVRVAEASPPAPAADAPRPGL
jgi:RND family efflux transporter MFP subunit